MSFEEVCGVEKTVFVSCPLSINICIVRAHGWVVQWMISVVHQQILYVK